MIRINKAAAEPFVFKDVKSRYATYDDLYGEDKDALKKVLVAEQNNLCAYCMEKIRMDNSSIEHYFPRHPGTPEDADKSLSYYNLFAVCTTSKNLPDRQKFCEAKRGNIALSINPMIQAHIDTLSYSRDGKIFSNDHDFSVDINSTLNLNCSLLCRNRKDAWSDYIKKLDERKPGKWSKEYLAREIDRIESGETTIPYVGYILFFLKKRLGQCG